VPYVPDIDEIRRVLEEVLVERLDELRPLLEGGTSTGPALAPVGGTVRGLDPHRLYTAAQVAERLGYESPETVQRLDPALLPRAPWKGPGVRYWGADVLRMMGVSEEEIAAAGGATIHRMGPPAVKHPELHPRKRTGRRIKNNNLPSL